MVNVGGIKVWMIAVGKIFRRLYEAGKNPENMKREDLLSEFSICNYIPSGAQNEYAEALMNEYKKYYKEMIK